MLEKLHSCSSYKPQNEILRNAAWIADAVGTSTTQFDIDSASSCREQISCQSRMQEIRNNRPAAQEMPNELPSHGEERNKKSSMKHCEDMLFEDIESEWQ